MLPRTTLSHCERHRRSNLRSGTPREYAKGRFRSRNYPKKVGARQHSHSVCSTSNDAEPSRAMGRQEQEEAVITIEHAVALQKKVADLQHDRLAPPRTNV